MIFDEDSLAHYGTPRHSGRYPWGSGGDNPSGTRNAGFLDHVAAMRKEGLSNTEIAKGLGMTTTEFRARNSIEKNAAKQADIAMAQRLRDKGMGASEIARRMDRNESSVRALLAPGVKDKTDRLTSTANMLKENVAKKKFVDVGAGVEYYIGVSRGMLNNAIAVLREHGYALHNVQIDQLGTGAGKKTAIKVLAPPGTTYKDIVTNMSDIKSLHDMSTEDNGRTYFGILPPTSLNSKRLKINYAEDGGAKADGVIYVRPGKEDLSLGGSRYAQVRIMVDGTHYIKGMAMYKDDLPPGVDVVFNTNKSRADAPTKKDALKKLTGDPDNPFGAVISRQIGIKNARGEVVELTSHMNILNEEGDWDTWSRNLSSQFLSKQKPTLIKSQLDVTYDKKKSELDEIMSLTNPEVRRTLLEKFADSADSAAVHLKAAQLPRQSSHVILPLNSIKEGEIYAPNFKDGERVVLVRHPHGGTFEIPELTVNNRNREARKAIGTDTKDAVGIHHKVAERLSGADFDGDSVLVIPQRSGTLKVQTSEPLKDLKNFDARTSYPGYPGMPKMSARTKGVEMGKVSNLITDMTLKGATHDEIARAVKHSMVVIDAEKHELNYKQSAIDNGIAFLQKKYQRQESGRSGGASTLISRAGSTARIPERRIRKASEGGGIDPRTGKRIFVETGKTYPDRKTGETVIKRQEIKKLELVDDAHTLSSGLVQEKLYADYSNRMKDLANQARKASLQAKPVKKSASAEAAYKNEVASLNSKLAIALRNAPLERQAQVIANRVYADKRQAVPDMDDAQKKKVKYQALTEARRTTGAGKERVEITPSEWDAIQAGAVSPSKLKDILDNADVEHVKKLATPKEKVLMTSSKKQRALSMAAAGYNQAEIAAALGVSLSTLKRSVGGE